MQHKFIQTTNYINCLEAMKELARLPRDMEKWVCFMEMLEEVNL